MAENESLDLGKSKRWRAVHQVVLDGLPTPRAARRALRSLFGTIRAVQKQFKEHGVTLDQFLEAAQAGDRNTLSVLTKQCKGHDFARLFLEVAESGIGRESLVEEYAWAVCDKFLDQIEYGVASVKQRRWLPDIHRYLDEVRGLMEEDVHRLAGKLAEDADWLPKMRPGKAANGMADETAEKLGESLLALAPR